MKDPEEWKRLCERAAVEKDPDRLLALVKEINRLLDEKKEQLGGSRKSPEQEG